MSSDEEPVSTRSSGTSQDNYSQDAGPGMPEPVTFEDCERRINEIAEVTQLTIPLSGSDHAPVPEARAWDLGIEGANYYRTPEAMW